MIDNQLLVTYFYLVISALLLCCCAEPQHCKNPQKVWARFCEHDRKECGPISCEGRECTAILTNYWIVDLGDMKPPQGTVLCAEQFE
jgi:hypothetical protein